MLFSHPYQAKFVASATGNLCEAANSVVQGQALEEKLIVAAKDVASSTVQLLIACQVKANTGSENNRRLQVCMQYSGNVWVGLGHSKNKIGLENKSSISLVLYIMAIFKNSDYMKML